MKNAIKFILCMIPLAYAIYSYPLVPDTIAIHFNAQGEADGFGSKKFLFLGGLLPIFTLLVLYFIRKLDPKQRIQEMGSKFEYLQLGIIFFMTLTGLLLIHSMTQGSLKMDIRYLFWTISGFQILLGNYMPAMKPNYFMGIRTPWTLENETVWKKTHSLGGKLLVVSSLIFLLSSVILPMEYIYIAFMICTLVPYIFLIGYSYLIFSTSKSN